MPESNMIDLSKVIGVYGLCNPYGVRLTMNGYVHYLDIVVVHLISDLIFSNSRSEMMKSILLNSLLITLQTQYTRNIINFQ